MHLLRSKWLTTLLCASWVLAPRTPSQTAAKKGANGPGTKQPIWLDPSQPLQKRVDALVSSMTLPEKVSQMQSHAAAIPRLDVPECDYWSEGLHGVADSGYATLFPQAIGVVPPGTLRSFITWPTSYPSKAPIESA